MKLHNFDFSKKVFFHPKNIVAYMEEKRPFPITMEVDLTNCCNHNCSFCCHAEYLKTVHASLPTEIIKERLTEAWGLGTKGICFTGGGEPMLHKDFFEILEHSKNLGLSNGLITNGSVIQDRHLDQIVDLLQWIRISMGGGDAESYQIVQGVPVFEKVIGNIRKISQRIKESRSSLDVGVRFLVMRENIESLKSLAKILRDISIDYLQLAPDHSANDHGKFWNEKYTQRIFKEVGKIIEKNNIKLLRAGYIGFEDRVSYPQACYAHFFHIAITANGSVSFCKCHRNEKMMQIGNIHDQTLSEIWDGEITKDLEKWVKPSNCGAFCKHMASNIALEEILHPDESLMPNFVG